jgi:hypothetical protein
VLEIRGRGWGAAGSSFVARRRRGQWGEANGTRDQEQAAPGRPSPPCQESAEKKSRGMVRDPRVRMRRPTRTDASAWWADGGVRLQWGGVVMRPCLDQRPGND